MLLRNFFWSYKKTICLDDLIQFDPLREALLNTYIIIKLNSLNAVKYQIHAT